YLKSRNGTYNSYCYAIYLMQTASGNGAVIANNTIENAFYGIIVEAPNTLIYNNTISNIGGPAAILASGDNIVVSSNNVSVEFSNPDDSNVENWNEDGNVVAIQNTGKNNIIANNTLKSVGSDSILNTGINVKILNNTIYTESANCINTTKSNAVIENNTLKGINSSGVMIFTSRLAENITIRNNDIVSDKSAIVLRGNVSYTLVCDNRINISGDSDAIAVLKYTNRNPITPSHYAIYNNTINGQIVNMTDPSEIERNDTDNGTGNGTNGTGGEVDEGTYSDSKINTTITVVETSIPKGNALVIYLKDKDGNPISGENVTFVLLNNVYTRTTDGEGKASLQINANVGNYAMNISFAGNDDYNPCKVSTKISVLRSQFIVTEDNFYTCFDDNGYLKSEFSDYELIFKGNFNNKRIILNHPVILKSEGAKLSDSVIKIESDNVVVNGFKIVNSNPGNANDNHRFAILLDNVKNVNVTNNDIQLSSYDNGYGIYVSESSNCSILNNTVKVKANALTFGIMLYDSNRNTLKNNDIFVNGTSKPHQYDSTIKVDSSISVDDNEAEGMVIPEVYKT
ncbi:MAG: right-handed parallel beta-helix repeat-containing protein, partial [Methanobrevibacter sp.]|nr:right-handed parallel beta-helix repeat-containing protein [Methanobrevibacter sp.]